MDVYSLEDAIRVFFDGNVSPSRGKNVMTWPVPCWGADL